MRLRAILFAVVVLAGVSAAAWKARAEIATDWFERATAEQIATALDAAGQEWVERRRRWARGHAAGAAPDETSRFRALEIARQIVDARPDRRRDHARRRRAAAAAALRARAAAQRRPRSR